MLVIAILILASIVATIVALIVASPLFRTVTLAVDSWADSLQASAGPPR